MHLGWAGMIDCEGHVLDLPEIGGNSVPMLRFWFSERTLWCRSSPCTGAAGLTAASAGDRVQVGAVSTIGERAPDLTNWPI